MVTKNQNANEAVEDQRRVDRAFEKYVRGTMTLDELQQVENKYLHELNSGIASLSRTRGDADDSIGGRITSILLDRLHNRRVKRERRSVRQAHST